MFDRLVFTEGRSAITSASRRVNCGCSRAACSRLRRNSVCARVSCGSAASRVIAIFAHPSRVARCLNASSNGSAADPPMPGAADAEPGSAEPCTAGAVSPEDGAVEECSAAKRLHASVANCAGSMRSRPLSSAAKAIRPEGRSIARIRIERVSNDRQGKRLRPSRTQVFQSLELEANVGRQHGGAPPDGPAPQDGPARPEPSEATQSANPNERW